LDCLFLYLCEFSVTNDSGEVRKTRAVTRLLTLILLKATG
jgi:hypothetical protein